MNVQSQRFPAHCVQVWQVYEVIMVRLSAKVLVGVSKLRSKFVLDILVEGQEVQNASQSTRSRIHSSEHECPIQ